MINQHDMRISDILYVVRVQYQCRSVGIVIGVTKSSTY